MKASVPAAAPGMIDVGGELTLARLGYGASPGRWCSTTGGWPS